ncbi:MAG: DNA-binding transcriptional regulator [Tepidisphaeraceae bacterium]
MVLVQTTEMACYRESIRGVNAYATFKGNWQVERVAPTVDVVGFIRQQKPDGALFGMMPSHRQFCEALDLVKHCVSVIGQHFSNEVRRIPEVESDDLAVGEMAARYFREKGFQNFAFIGADAKWSRERWEGYERVLKAMGLSPHFMRRVEARMPGGHGWERPQYGSEVMDWIRSLPKPLAVLACNDIRGAELIDACRTASIRVPDDVAVLGVDNDDMDCEMSHPPLSSVSIPWRLCGYRSAAILDNLMEGRDVPVMRELIGPAMVVERQSTNTLAIGDEDVAAAARFIRDNAHRQIGVEDILKEVSAARRSLEKRFRDVMGRSLLEEIRKVHVERAKVLLSTTDMSMAEVAERSGFASPAWFSKTFSEIAGEAPVEFRRQTRNGVRRSVLRPRLQTHVADWTSPSRVMVGDARV